MVDQPNNQQPSSSSPSNDIALPQAPAAAATTPAPASTPINVINPEGQLVSIPGEQLSEALDSGYQMATSEHVQAYAKQQKYGTAEQQAKTVAEGVAQGLAGPLATAAETHLLGVKPEDIEGRAEVNPGEHFASELGGLAAPALVSAGSSVAARAGLEGAGAVAQAAKAAAPFTQSGVLEAAGEGALKALGISETSAPLAKIGSAAVKGAVENAVFQGGDETSKMIMGDPNQSAETVAAHIGLAGLIGAPVGGAFGSIPELWKAASGSKTAGLLRAITDRLGGAENAVPSEVDKALEQAGVSASPEIRASLSSDPEIRAAASALNQSDTTTSGRAYQEAQKRFRKDLGDSAAKALGVENPEALEGSSEFSAYQHGKKIGTTLAEEFDAQTSPLSKEYDELHNKFKGADLSTSVSEKMPEAERQISKLSGQIEKLIKQAQKAMEKGDPGAAVDLAARLQELEGQLREVRQQAQAPGTVDKLVERIQTLAEREGWTASPSSDIMREVNRVTKELPGLKKLGDLSNYIKAVGDQMQSDPLNKSLSRAGGLIKSELRRAESDLIGTHIGSEEGAEALSRYQAVREAYARQSELREALDSRLRAKGSTSGYAKSLREMAQTDGEAIARRLSGEGDADLLTFLEGNFPKTAEAIREYHIDRLVKQAVGKAKPGENINVAALRKSISSMSPELRQFAVTPEAMSKVDAIGTVLDQLNDSTHNFSNTARTADKLFEYLPSSAVGLATMLTGHNPAVALLLGSLTKALSKDAPDAIRLSMLKFLGSQNPIKAEGFKAMVDFMHEAAKGDGVVNRATKNVFRSSSEVLSEAQMPSEADRRKLSKSLEELDAQPQRLLRVAEDTSHYLPDHGQAMSQMAANATSYLKSVRPNTDVRNPLDTKPEANPIEKAAYNRALDIANQPLLVVHSIKTGRITPQDVVSLKTMYPNLYAKLQTKLTMEMMDRVHKGEAIPYQMRLGLAMFLGKPLDSTMTPEGIMGAQPKPQMAQPQTAMQPASNPKHSTSSLGKLNKMYVTPLQAAEGRRGSKD